MRIAERVASWSTQLRCCRGQAGARINVNDFIGRESRALADGDAFAGKYKFRYCRTPHLPHCWDAGMLACSSKRRKEHFFVRTYSNRSAMLNRSRQPIPLAARAKHSRHIKLAFWQIMFPA